MKHGKAYNKSAANVDKDQLYSPLAATRLAEAQLTCHTAPARPHASWSLPPVKRLTKLVMQALTLSASMI
jgi:hypothetical protein